MKKIGILYHPLNEAAQTLANNIQRFIQSRKIAAWTCSSWERETATGLLDGTDLILSVGGDGTILRAAQIALEKNIPITGINRGTLGFMTEFLADEVEEKLDVLLNGQGWIDERAMLEAKLVLADGAYNYFALNDVVMARGAIARLINIDASIDGRALTAYRADGIVLATATGSTGYAFAAGGPILYPGSREILLTPIMPHLSPDYSLVLPETATVKLVLHSALPATLSVDGHFNLALPDGAELTVKLSSKVTRFLRLTSREAFFPSLEQKLKGKRK